MIMIALRMMVTGLLFVATLGSGLWLSHAGKPLNVVLFTSHKLIALGTVVAAAFTLYRSRTSAPFPAATMAAIIVTGLVFLLLFVTGGLLRSVKAAQPGLLVAHQAGAGVAAIALAVTVYLLVSRRP